jgi:hypothetical protein
MSLWRVAQRPGRDGAGVQRLHKVRGGLTDHSPEHAAPTEGRTDPLVMRESRASRSARHLSSPTRSCCGSRVRRTSLGRGDDDWPTSTRLARLDTRRGGDPRRGAARAAHLLWTDALPAVDGSRLDLDGVVEAGAPGRSGRPGWASGFKINKQEIRKLSRELEREFAKNPESDRPCEGNRRRVKGLTIEGRAPLAGVLHRAGRRGHRRLARRDGQLLGCPQWPVVVPPSSGPGARQVGERRVTGPGRCWLTQSGSMDCVRAGDSGHVRLRSRHE